MANDVRISTRANGVGYSEPYDYAKLDGFGITVTSGGVTTTATISTEQGQEIAMEILTAISGKQKALAVKLAEATATVNRTAETVAGFVSELDGAEVDS